MCLKYHSLYRCKCEGKPQIEPCGKISRPQVPYCIVQSFPSNRAFCCSIICCNKDLAFAKTRFAEALEQREAWSPSFLESLCQKAYVQDQEEQLDKRLAAARELLDEAEEVHRKCFQMQEKKRVENQRARRAQMRRQVVEHLLPVEEEEEDCDEYESDDEQDKGVANPVADSKRPKGKEIHPLNPLGF